MAIGADGRRVSARAGIDADGRRVSARAGIGTDGRRVSVRAGIDADGRRVLATVAASARSAVPGARALSRAPLGVRASGGGPPEATSGAPGPAGPGASP